MAVALAALLFAMAGTGLAAQRYVVSTSSQIKNGAVTGADVRNGSLTGNDIKSGSLTARSFDGSIKGQTGPAGPQGATGPAGVAYAYAHVNSDGTFSAARSKNVVGVVPVGGATPYYCLDIAGMSAPDIHAVVATLTLDGSAPPGEVGTYVATSMVGSFTCDLIIRTYDSSGTAATRGFDVMVN